MRNLLPKIDFFNIIQLLFHIKQLNKMLIKKYKQIFKKNSNKISNFNNQKLNLFINIL